MDQTRQMDDQPKNLTAEGLAAMPTMAPYSMEAEKSLLGSILLDPKSFEKVSDRLTSKCFYLRQHQVIFEAIEKISAHDSQVDPVTVCEEMIRLGHIEKNSALEKEAFSYLTGLVISTANSANIDRYAQIVSSHYMRREIIAVGNDLMVMGSNPEGKSEQDILNLAETRLFLLTQANQKDEGLVHLDVSLGKVIEEIEYEQERAEQGLDSTYISGLDTGFNELNQTIDGLQPGQLIIIAGRPSMGKTSLALNIAETVSLNQTLPVAVFSLEMPAKDIAKRLISSLSRIEYKRIRQSASAPSGDSSTRVGFSPGAVTTAGLSDSEWNRVHDALSRLSKSSIYVDEKGAATIHEIRSRCRKLARASGGIALVIVDYLQLMSSKNVSKVETRALEIAEDTRALKALAKELNCPVIVLSQLNRSLEQRANKRPVMSDLRESGAIEQDADLILFIYRDQVYNPDSMDIGTAEIIIGKQRNGPIGTLKVNFLDYCARFEDSL